MNLYEVTDLGNKVHMVALEADPQKVPGLYVDVLRRLEAVISEQVRPGALPLRSVKHIGSILIEK